MIQIRNIGRNLISLSTSYTGGQGRPLYLRLGDAEVTFIQQAELSNWPGGAKQNLADYVQKGQLRVNERACVHNVIDEGHTLPPLGAFDVPSAITTATDFVEVYNKHAKNDSIHTAQDLVNVVLLAAPTDLATLMAYVGAVQTSFDAHILSVVHPNADTYNSTSVVIADYSTTIDALKELYGRFHRHKQQLLVEGTTLSPPAIIAY